MIKNNSESLSRALEPLIATRYPLQLPSEYRYAHLSLALIDAIFSLGARYESTRATVLRYARTVGLKPFRESVAKWPALADQQPLDDLVILYRQRDLSDILSLVYQNRQRTSTHSSSISKAEAVFHAAQLLREYHVNYFQDIPKIMGNPTFDTAFRQIRGQGPGTGLSYFWMLTGSEEHIKADRMILRFIERASNIHGLTAQDAQNLVADAVELLRPRFPLITLRQIDYLMWDHERSQDTPK